MKKQEFLEAFDKSGALVKVQERTSLLGEIENYSKAEGDAHLAVRVSHMMLLTSDHRLRLVQRAATKSINPLLFDNTVAGHVEAGGSHDLTVIREAWEEVGVRLLLVSPFDFHEALRAADLQKEAVARLVGFEPWHSVMCKMKSDGTVWKKRERCAVYIGFYDGPLNFLDQEAASEEILSMKEALHQVLVSPEKFTVEVPEMLRKYHYFMEPIH